MLILDFLRSAVTLFSCENVLMESLIRRAGRLLFGRVLPRVAYPVLSGPLKSSRFILGSMAGHGGGASVYFNKLEPEQTDAMLQEMREGQVFFDIGANVGYYSILASKIVGKTGTVVACEPVVRNLTYLQRHVELNKADNVRILAFVSRRQRRPTLKPMVEAKPEP